MLVPRIRIVADDRLAGASREAVQTRLDLWLKTHVEKLLGPLFELSKAEDVTGIARGIAFQLVEALGVLDRQKISAEIKGLDQPARASLRKYGVRFGAYHIYIPILLKPAARSLALQLSALKRGEADTASLAGIQQLAGSGRTSFAIDKEIDRDAYLALGYKVCGERAVRVDILERLADLIRAALSWREGSPVPRPAGAFDGRSFTVTQAMTSLVGSTGEDFAAMLRRLAIAWTAVRLCRRHLSRRLQLPRKRLLRPWMLPNMRPPSRRLHLNRLQQVRQSLPQRPNEVAPVAARCGAFAPRMIIRTCRLPARLRRSSMRHVDAPIVETPAATEPPVAPEAADVAAADSTPAATAEPTVAAAPELVEVWRAGGRFEDRRPRHERHRHHRHQPPSEAQAGDAAAEASGKAEGAHKEHRRRRRRHGDRPRPDVGAPAPVEGATDAAIAAAPARGRFSGGARQAAPRAQ